MKRQWDPHQAIQDISNVEGLVPHIRDRLCAMRGDEYYESQPDDHAKVTQMVSTALAFLASCMPPPEEVPA